jgi:hypothetical protein
MRSGAASLIYVCVLRRSLARQELVPLRWRPGRHQWFRIGVKPGTPVSQTFDIKVMLASKSRRSQTALLPLIDTLFPQGSGFFLCDPDFLSVKN